MITLSLTWEGFFKMLNIVFWFSRYLWPGQAISNRDPVIFTSALLK